MAKQQMSFLDGVGAFGAIVDIEAITEPGRRCGNCYHCRLNSETFGLCASRKAGRKGQFRPLAAEACDQWREGER